jgi:RNA polymerase sigma-54 factor
MSLDLKQSFKLTQQILMTPQLQQAIKLLQLSRLEVEQFLQQQMVENPVLEEDEIESIDRESIEKSSEEIISDEIENSVGQIVDQVSPDVKNDFDWELMPNFGDSSPNYTNNYNQDEDGFVNYDNFISKGKTLHEYLQTQMGELNLDEEEKIIGEKLIGNISEKGFLDLDLNKFCEDEKVDPLLVEGVLDTIQRLDPLGVGARDLNESLLIQLRELKLKNGIVEKIVEFHWHDLEVGNYQTIAKNLKITHADVVENIGIIAGLNPIPGRQFSDEVAQFIIPDVYVFKRGDKWIIHLNDDNLPRLKVNDYYREVAHDYKKGEEKSYINEKIKSAQWLIKSIHQRQKTILRVMECIVMKQQEFFEKGVEFLRPMILKDVAEIIELHESTVSRATNNKYAHTPRGIFELKYFFSSSLQGREGEDVASESVKMMLKEIVSKEPKGKPYSDLKIVALLEEKGVNVARRTVAKYREQLGILPSSKRKRMGAF